MQPITRAALACAVAVLAGCATGPLKHPPEVHCVAWKPALRIEGGLVYFDRGACRAWAVGGRFTGGWR